MFKDIINMVEKKYNDKKEENEKLNTLLQTSKTFENLFPIPKLSNEPSKFKILFITNESPDINKEKAELISKLIPTEETYLSVFYTKELLTNTEYYLVPTNNYLWVINLNNYGAYHYNKLKATIIKNNLMSKIILLNNIVLEINGPHFEANHVITSPASLLFCDCGNSFVQ